MGTHPDANTNAKIPWKESVTGRSIIRLKVPGATLDTQQRYDGASDKMVAVDDASLQLLRKNLPPEKIPKQDKHHKHSGCGFAKRGWRNSVQVGHYLNGWNGWTIVWRSGYHEFDHMLTKNDVNQTQRHIFLRAKRHVRCVQ